MYFFLTLPKWYNFKVHKTWIQLCLRTKPLALGPLPRAIFGWTTHTLRLSVPTPECLRSRWKESCNKQTETLGIHDQQPSMGLLCYSNILCSQLTVLLSKRTVANCVHSVQVSSPSLIYSPLYSTV